MAVQTFKQYIDQKQIRIDILQSDESTHTALQASQVHKVPVSNIVKSLLVKVDDTFKMFLVPGDRKLDLEGIKHRFNSQSVRMANADEVKEITGYSIGGVPPFGHKNEIETYIEDGFDINNDVVAAAGSSTSVFRCSLDNLKRYVNEV